MPSLLPPSASGLAAPKRKKPPWEAALIARSQYLNEQNQLGKWAAPGSDSTTGATTVTPAPGSPGSVTVPGYDPDYEALIKGDPNVLSGESDLSRFSGQLEDARRAAIRRAVIGTGLIPDATIGDIDQQTLAAAKANRFSTAAQLALGRTRGSTDLAARLAGRGILQSGALTGGENRLQDTYEQGTSDALGKLLDSIGGFEGEFTSKQADIAARRAALREAAATRIQNDPRYQPRGKGVATLDPASGLYVTEDGRWYDASGNRVAPPAAPVAAAPGVVGPPAGVRGGVQYPGLEGTVF